MKSKRAFFLMLGAVLLAGTGEAVAASSPDSTVRNQHVQRHLRVDGASDLRGSVRARSGLRVTVGLTTDRLHSTGPVTMDGILRVAGIVTAGGLNTGANPITTTGALQGGTLALSGGASIAGDTSFAGNLSVGRTLTAGSVSLGSGSLQAGFVNANTINSGGAVTAGSITSSGAVTAGSGTFASLTVAPGGTVNFNNAAVSGLTLTGNASLSSLRIASGSAGGINGTQALIISQAGQTTSLSVDSFGILTVAGAGLSTPALTVSNNASVGGTLTTNRIASGSQLVLSAPSVATTGNLSLSANGDLLLNNTGSSVASHILGNHDTRGQCTATVSAGSTSTCGVIFTDPYSSTPIVVVSPSGTDPTVVSGFSVQAFAGGFTIYSTGGMPGTNVTFSYIVQG